MIKTMYDYVTLSVSPVKEATKHNEQVMTIEDGIDDDLHCIVDNKHDEKVMTESVKHIEALLEHNSLGKVYSLRQDLREPVEDIVSDFKNAEESEHQWAGANVDNIPSGALDSTSNYYCDVHIIKYWIHKYESNPDNVGMLINL